MHHDYTTGWRTGKATKHVFIAIPSYGDIKPICMSSISASQSDLLVNGIDGTLCLYSGNCHVDDARNVLCSMFLRQKEATHLMFVDADVGFGPTCIRTLLDYNEAMACGIYPKKEDREVYPIRTDGDPYIDERGLITNVLSATGGFMCIERQVIEKLFRQNARKGVWPHRGHIGVAEIFHRTIELGRSRRSGDIEFCDKVRKAGFNIVVDPRFNFNHVGDYAWTGNLNSFILRETGAMMEMAKETLSNLDNDPSPRAFNLISMAYDNFPFACDGTILGVLWHLMKELGPDATFLETGSGASTAILASQWKGSSFEHSRAWMGKTQEFMEGLGLPTGCIEYKPLDGEWYSVDNWDYKPDLVFIDGPVRKVGGERAQIIDRIPDAIRSATTVVVDDTDDGDGKALLKRLTKEFGFEFEEVPSQRREFAIGRKAEAMENAA